jgi:chromosome segregation ATPase
MEVKELTGNNGESVRETGALRESGGGNGAGETAGGIEVFSDEERREISGRIEAASRREAVPPPGPPARGEASRKGFFPLVVNAAGILFLGAGLLLLSSIQRADSAEIRESGAELGITERALIREIRREVNLQLTEKDGDIIAMERRIAEVDDELARLESLEALTGEQRETMAALREQQEGYRGDLTRLEAERALILAEARQKEAEARRREARLHARLAEQEGALEDMSARNRAELAAARAELAKLTGDDEKAALVERQLAGYYSAFAKQIQAGQYREAAGTLAALKEFLATPSFQQLKLIGSRRESDAAAIAAMTGILSAAAGKSSGPSSGGSLTPAEIVPPVAGPGAGGPGTGAPEASAAETALRRQLADQAAALAQREQTLADRDRALGELQKKHDGLQDQNGALRQTLADRDRQLESLQAQNAANLQKIETLQKTISTINAALNE